MFDTIHDWIYEQVVLQTKFINKHREDIMRTTIIYGKQQTAIIIDGKEKYKHTVTVSEYYIKSYAKIMNPNFIQPLMSESDLKEYMNDNNRVDTKKLYDYYKDTILGNEKDVDIDDINSGKAKLIEGIKLRFDNVKSNKSKILDIRKNYKLPSNNLTPEEVKDFQNISMAQIESLKAYNRVILDYCKGATSILKKFIKNSNEKENKKEDK